MTLPPAQSPVPGSGPASRQRPAVVTAACGLMFGVAGLGLIGAILSMTMLGPIREAVEGIEFDDPQLQQAGEQIATFTVWASGCGIAFNLLFAAAFAVLAIFNLRGSNGARITTWVLTGLSLLCGVCGLTLQGVGGALPGAGGDPNQEKINQALEAATPSWYGPVTLVLAGLSVLAYIGIVILLALPAANEFFRRPVPQWQPPVEYGGASGVPYGAPAVSAPDPSEAPPAGFDPWGGAPPPSGAQPPVEQPQPPAWTQPPAGQTGAQPPAAPGTAPGPQPYEQPPSSGEQPPPGTQPGEQPPPGTQPGEQPPPGAQPGEQPPPQPPRES